jgi:4'-phosphopantetheinyl transferase EntD
VLELILPPCAAVATTRQEVPGATLFPEEEAALGRAVEKRRQEFTTARACAREALRKLGFPPQAIPSGAGGAPQWPAGIVGSITHCRGYRACAVAHTSDLATIGVDAEPNEPLPEGVLADIALSSELGWLANLSREAPEVSWDRLLFSIKEAVYKAWFPLTGRWLGFEDASVTVDRTRCAFTAQLLVPGPVLDGCELSSFSGRWLIRDSLVLTAIALPAS